MSYYLNQLNQSLSSYNKELDRLEKKLEKEKEKLSSIKSIIKDIKRDFDDVVGDIKKVSKKTADYLEDGIKGSSKIPPLVDEIENMKEAHVEQDKYMSEALSKLEAEKNRIENLIKDLEEEIRTTKSNIKSIKSDIASEEKRIEDEERAARLARESDAQKKVEQSKKVTSKK